jgi:hypothetical protein
MRAADSLTSLAYARNVWRDALARNPDDPNAPLYRRALEDVERSISARNTSPNRRS